MGRESTLLSGQFFLFLIFLEFDYLTESQVSGVSFDEQTLVSAY